ncbi:MAG: sigma-54 dependent transcriptional regulator, partial [Gammaproteobacteria bacterium]|nr:sigma-54 dependent transcriptional regulator [Gammaproteobacteria bacterium]
SGTGKEKFARMIHFSSQQKDQPFITVNCAAIPDNLLESELFGHTKGSFTGATQNKIGKFEAANNVTLFLDEIGDMNYDLQAKLLRALQEKTIQRVGSTTETTINVRVITATHKNIKDAVNQGHFRLDLYYRLNVLPIELPPLRERKGDIKLLSLFFLNRANQRHRKNISLTAEIIHHLDQHQWPGNIRQLENVIERIVILSETEIVTKDQVRYFLDDENSVSPINSTVRGFPGAQMFNRPYAKVNENERNMILESLKTSGGNKTQAALNLGMTPRQLHYRIEKLAIET